MSVQIEGVGVGGKTLPLSDRMDPLGEDKENQQNTEGEENLEKMMKKPSRSTLQGAAIKTLFIVCSAAIIFISLRNSLTYHLSNFWGGVGDVWQLLWIKLLDTVGDDYFNLCFYGTFIVANTVYFTVGGIYAYLDLTLTPKFLRIYKIQPESNEPLDRPKFYKLLRTVIFNQTVMFAGFNYVMFFLYQSRGFQDIRVLPEFHWVVFELMICVLVEEVAFYYGHLLMHHKSIYKHIHKKHHEWTAAVSFVSLYAHPFEHIVCNLLPPALGPLLLGSHVATIWLWSCLALLSTLNAHSGYHFPFFPSPEAHDFHHMKFNQCYGVLGIMDYVHGTDALFRSNQAYQRHIILVGSTPLRETFPDPQDVNKEKKLN